MKARLDAETDRRMAGAVEDLHDLILGHCPNAGFELSHGEGDDLEGWHLTATVDIPDTDDVIDLVIDRLMHYQVDEDLQVYVIPVQPLERAAEQLRTRTERRPAEQTPRSPLRPAETHEEDAERLSKGERTRQARQGQADETPSA